MQLQNLLCDLTKYTLQTSVNRDNKMYKFVYKGMIGFFIVSNNIFRGNHYSSEVVNYYWYIENNHLVNIHISLICQYLPMPKSAVCFKIYIVLINVSII